jgi:hypothetical protein
MRTTVRIVIGICVIGALAIGASADQAPKLNTVMRAKLGRAQGILAAVVTSDIGCEFPPFSLNRQSKQLLRTHRI